MESTYIQFETPKTEYKNSPDGFLKRSFKKVIIGVLASITPKASPDFEKEIDNVKSWLVELDTETGIPQREIGLDEGGKTILKMPYKGNFGYWTDNNLLLDDFKRHFHAREIEKMNFEIKWDLFL